MTRPVLNQSPIGVVVMAAVVLIPASATAVDTVETWDVGATDVDFYFGFDGVGLHRHERSLSGDLMLGYGIIERLSAYLGATLSADEYLSNGVGQVYLGGFGTPVETDHFDLDLFLDFRLGGEGFGELRIGPAMELNVDLVPDRERWGVFFVVGAPISNRTTTDAQGSENEETVVSVEATVGTYLTLGTRHQVLLDYTMAFHPMADDDEIEVGSVGVGYNVEVHEAVELISEVRVDVPQEGERVAVGFVVGFIATLPSQRTVAATTIASPSPAGPAPMVAAVANGEDVLDR